MITILTLWTATLPLPDISAAREDRADVLLKRLLQELKTHGCALDPKSRHKLFVNRVDGTKLIGVAYAGSGINERGPYDLTMRAREGELCIDNKQAHKLLLRVKNAEFVVHEKGGGSTRARIEQGTYPFRLPNDFSPLARPIPAVTVTGRRLDDPPAGEKEIRLLASQLGSTSYRERAAAEKRLLEMGENILPILRKIDTAKDLETENRLNRIRHRLTKHEVMVS